MPAASHPCGRGRSGADVPDHRVEPTPPRGRLREGVGQGGGVGGVSLDQQGLGARLARRRSARSMPAAVRPSKATRWPPLYSRMPASTRLPVLPTPSTRSPDIGLHSFLPHATFAETA